jgi:hypothetical protein
MAYSTYYTDSRITNLATAILLFFMTVLLVCYFIVVNVGDGKGCVCCFGILFLFTLILSCSMSFYSKAKRHSVLAATAA